MMDDRRFQIMFDNLSEYQLELIQKMKYHAIQLGECIEQLTPKRETALAFTNLEQGMMWAIKAVCLEAEGK